MSFAKPLIEDLRRREAKIKNCGYYSLSFKEKAEVKKVDVLQKGSRYDLNVYFEDKVPASKLEFDCGMVEIEVFGGIPDINKSDLSLLLIKGSSEVVVGYERMNGKEMRKIGDYLSSFGYRARFSKGYF